MRIVVIIGRVLDPGGFVVNRRAGRIFVNREEYILHPADRDALEAALRIRDTTAAEVIALPRRPLPDDDVLRQALARGADRAIHLTGEGWRQADDAVMTQVLAAAVERLGGADLVLTGATTLDTGQSQLGPRLAEALGWPQVVGAWQVTLEPGGGAVEGTVRAVILPSTASCRGAGYTTVEANLPALVTVVPGSLKLRYPDGVRLINVYRAEKAVEQWDVSDLVSATARQPLLEKRGEEFPPERERGMRVRGSAEEMAQTVAKALTERLR